MQHLEVSCAVRRLFKSLGFKGLSHTKPYFSCLFVWVWKLVTRIEGGT